MRLEHEVESNEGLYRDEVWIDDYDDEEVYLGSSTHLISLGKYIQINLGVIYKTGQGIQYMKLQYKKILA